MIRRSPSTVGLCRFVVPGPALLSGPGAWTLARRPSFGRPALAFGGPRDALEDVADADPGLLQHARLSGHDPGEVRPDQHRGDLEDQLVDVGVARQLSPGYGLTQRLGELFEPSRLQLHHPVAGTPGTRRELHRDGRDEAAARKYPPFQVSKERLA